MLIAGIDEAGRGPCIGPLVMAVALINKNDEQRLIDIGVKDSKLLTANERESQFPLIKSALLEFRSSHVSPQEIDGMVGRRGLNELEAMHAAKLLNSLSKKPDVAYVDSPDVVMDEFARRIRKFLSFPVKIISEHKADLNYPIVSAASIIAKVERDRAIRKISGEFGEVGSGYPGDEATISFLKKYFINNSEVPGFVRKSWQTIKDLQEKKYQKKLF